MRIAQAQDREAFARLYRLYAPKLKGFALSLGATAPLAEEVVQESFLNVWRRAGQFDPQRGSASAWLFSIARNSFLSHVRRQQRFDDEPLTTDDEAPPSPERQAVMRETQRHLQAAYETLPPEQAEVVRFAYVQGLALSQIAQELGLPLGTVKTRARLALEKLRVLFEPPEDPS